MRRDLGNSSTKWASTWLSVIRHQVPFPPVSAAVIPRRCRVGPDAWWL